MSVKKIGICTGGGDCPGLNAVIRGVVRSAIIKHGWHVIGIEDSFDGLIWTNKQRELTLREVGGLLPRGGTILGTTNRGDPFHYKVMEGGQEQIRDFSDEVLRNARAAGLDALVVIGGDGTLKIALELYRKGLNLVGVPKTIDNDLSATDLTFGFDTALHTATDAIDKIHTTAESHHRIMLVEVMGRDTGWIALEAGLASGAHVILIPEIPFTIDRICDFVRSRESEGRKYTTIVVAEGVNLPAEIAIPVTPERRAVPRGGVRAGQIGDVLARRLQREVRVTVLGHIQRGGSPSPFDRILSTRFGVAATDLIARGEFGRMVCLKGAKVLSVDIAEAVGVTKSVDPKGELVEAARAIGICFGD
ncbi:MAG: 6-phosphofructokinase [Acidobacteriia bacterium]|nr:6-phosphofructokinase [Terriglobia bacterium]